ncbi:MAG: HAMP domain-containing histidine kinase, partial [Chloroflexi bacterium]|nr:HAMP domain-containing histidine kinase [Chloroflexota bacterium]
MFKLNSIRWRLTFSYAAIALLAAVALGLVLCAILRNYYAGQERRYLQERSAQIGFITSQLISSNVPYETIQDQSVGWSYILQVRIRIVDGAGKPIADSGAPDAPPMFYVTNVQPFQIVIGSAIEAQTREFETQALPQLPALKAEREDKIIFIDKSAVGVAVPADVTMFGLFQSSQELFQRRSSQQVEQTFFDADGNKIFTLTLSNGPAYGDEILSSVMNGWMVASVVAIILAALVGWVVSKRITMPLTELTRVTLQMSQGNLSARAEVRSNDEIGLLASSFNEMASQVEATVGALRSFVSDAAHELHTPLTALQTNLELARDEEKLSSRALYMDRAQEQSQRLKTLVSGLLDLSRIEAVPSRPEFLDLNLSKLLSEMAEQYASRAEQSNRTFELNLPKTEIKILGNEMQLQQVIMNLLENAIKFTHDGDTIRLSAVLEDGEVVVEVADTGIGIPAEE